MAKSNNESWTVTACDQDTTQTVRSNTVYTEAEATEMAKEWVEKYSDELIFVEFRRASDGQTSFLNPYGGYDLTGDAWN